MDLTRITPLVITYNEEPNIRRTLSKLAGFGTTIVLDSGSTDRTLEIAAGFSFTRTVHRQFDSFAEQCNFGLGLVETEFVLSLDADYEVSDAFIAELSALPDDPSLGGYSAPFIYRIFGHPLRATLYPRRTVLYRPAAASYRQEGHGHRVGIDGPVKALQSAIYHDDRKPLSRWFESQRKYAAAEAEFLLSGDAKSLGRTDAIRKMAWPAPILVLAYTLIWKRCLFDGWPGWFYALQRCCAEVMIALEVIDRRIASR